MCIGLDLVQAHPIVLTRLTLRNHNHVDSHIYFSRMLDDSTIKPVLHLLCDTLALVWWDRRWAHHETVVRVDSRVEWEVRDTPNVRLPACKLRFDAQ